MKLNKYEYIGQQFIDRYKSNQLGVKVRFTTFAPRHIYIFALLFQDIIGHEDTKRAPRCA